MKKLLATLLFPVVALFGTPAQAAPPGSYFYSDYLKNRDYHDYVAATQVPQSFSLDTRTGFRFSEGSLGYHAPVKDRGYLNWFFLSLAVGSVAYIIYKKT